VPTCRRITEEMETRDLSANTQRVYVARVIRFALRQDEWPYQWVTRRRSTTSLTPGAAHAAFSAIRRWM
jgi:hypothetical protein